MPKAFCVRCRALTEDGGDLCAKHRSAKSRPNQDAYRTPAYREMARAAKRMVGYPCPRCGKPMLGKRAPSVEHVIPVRAGGGGHVGGQEVFEVICRVCNSGWRRDTPRSRQKKRKALA